jgi:hypothetical protein
MYFTAVADLGSEALMTIDVKDVQTNIVLLRQNKNISPEQVSQRLAKVWCILAASVYL